MIRIENPKILKTAYIIEHTILKYTVQNKQYREISIYHIAQSKHLRPYSRVDNIYHKVQSIVQTEQTLQHEAQSREHTVGAYSAVQSMYYRKENRAYGIEHSVQSIYRTDYTACTILSQITEYELQTMDDRANSIDYTSCTILSYITEYRIQSMDYRAYTTK